MCVQPAIKSIHHKALNSVMVKCECSRNVRIVPYCFRERGYTNNLARFYRSCKCPFYLAKSTRFCSIDKLVVM